MAVYTEVSDEELSAFLDTYDIGTVLSYKGIAEGVENTNYLLHTTKGSYILTLYEKRVREDDLPFFLGLMQHLAHEGPELPAAGRQPRGEALGPGLAGRPAAIITFLEGIAVRRPTAQHCGAARRGAGEAASGRPGLSRCSGPTRSRSRPGRRSSRRPRRRPTRSLPGLAERDAAGARDYLKSAWPRGLPTGIIHADLFTDNVFFIGAEVSGLIDFYFACTDALRLRPRDLPQCLVLRDRRRRSTSPRAGR